jgi:hypothetical protein
MSHPPLWLLLWPVSGWILTFWDLRRFKWWNDGFEMFLTGSLAVTLAGFVLGPLASIVKYVQPK